MESPTAPAADSRLLNVPNQLSIARLVLSLVLFVLLGFGSYVAAFVVFVLTASTDWIDGYWARKYGQVTQLGRILDPFADKLLICGTFIFLCGVPRLADGTQPSGVFAWMAVVVVGREMLVTALRSFVENQGGDFSANWIGKWKMVLQCVAAGWSLVHLMYVDQSSGQWQNVPPAWMTTGLAFVMWATVLLTVYSGFVYLVAALRLLRTTD